MNIKVLSQVIIILLFSIYVTVAFSQSRIYEGPDDPAADPAAERETHMDGNRFQIYLNNTGYTGHWGYLDGSKWPRDTEKGLDMYDGLRLIVGGKVYVENDTIPVTNPTEIQMRSDLDELYIVESNASSETAPGGTISWALTPVFGYFNELSESPAISIDPNTWPIDGWPSRGDELKWPGEWNGRFGRGVQYAQLESYFVMNDAQDQEWIQPSRRVKYYPRRQYDGDGNVVNEVFIGDKRSTVTTQRGLPWGGLGLRVEVRGYQWNNPQTRDIVFWEYNVANISEHDLPEVVFGYMMDLGIGHYILSSDGEDDVGSFNDELDLSYCWDINGLGSFGNLVGTLGFAFLESPGIPNDFIDNDDDGLTDEKRENMAMVKVGPTDGITDLNRFLEVYGYESVDDLKEHWDADEDQDWRDGNDVNGNGIYDSGEDYGDDIGLDGVAPGDLNYYGPDADGTECNHQPDQLEGFGAEPNFGLTDVSESDMLGLTSFHLFQHPQGGSPSPSYDEDCYNLLAEHVLDEFSGTPNNLYQAFGTGPFRLDKGRTERISMATIGAFENLETLTNERIAPIIFDRKKVVQIIYESDYRFAKPPEMPTLKAIGADGKVILSWDDRADKLTREPLADGKNDFEGYKLYKASDRFFEDALLLRDNFGNPAGLKPYRQWDLKNDIDGHTDYALVEGEGYYLGQNSGIQHYYVDTDVQNGRTYFYYLAAYDHGLEEKNIAPTENVPTITVDENEIINFLSPNVQVVTPRAPAAGYADPTVDILHDKEDISGPVENLSVNILDPSSLRINHTYKMVFETDTVQTITEDPPLTAFWGHYFVNTGYKIYDATTDSLVFFENKEHFLRNHITTWETAGSGYGNNIFWELLRTGQVLNSDIFDGLQVSFELPLGEDGLAYFDSVNSGWFVGGQGLMNLTVYDQNIEYYPYRYDLVFTGGDEFYTTITTRKGRVGFGTGKTITSGQYLLEAQLPFYVEDKSHKDEFGQNLRLDLVAIDMNDNDQFDITEDEIFVGHTDYNVDRDAYTWTFSLFSFSFTNFSEEDIPQPGDIYRLQFVSPFLTSDTLKFRIPPYDLESGPLVEENLNNITVVPNPYVVTNTLEPAVRNNQLNQRRRLMFTNLPAVCTIKIFTMSGYLVDVIDVYNSQDNGTAYWDLLTKEDLEVAAGIYLYHVKSESTGKEKLGKFAIIK
jgi:hypothetical protein